LTPYQCYFSFGGRKFRVGGISEEGKCQQNGEEASPISERGEVHPEGRKPEFLACPLKKRGRGKEKGGEYHNNNLYDEEERAIPSKRKSTSVS